MVSRALRDLRNTPRAEGYSPAQLMFQRRQRTSLPCHAAAYQPVDIDDAEKRRAATRKKAKESFDNRAVVLRELKKGEKVIVQNPKSNTWELRGVIANSGHEGRSYDILLDDGFHI